MTTDNSDQRIRQISPTPEQFTQRMREAQSYVDSWPAWKRETRASNYPRPKVNE